MKQQALHQERRVDLTQQEDLRQLEARLRADRQLPVAAKDEQVTIHSVGEASRLEQLDR